MLEPISPQAESEIKKMEKICRERLERNPCDLDAMFTLAATMARLGNLELAVEIVEGLLAANPEYPGGMGLLAKFHDMLGNKEKSRKYVKKFLAVSEH